MSQQSLNRSFSILANITKCYLVTKEDGTERYIIEGLASGTDIDLTGERMAESAIDSMIASKDTNKIYLNNEHVQHWDSVYGEFTDLWKTEANDMMVRAELKPWHYRTVTLVKTLEEGGQIALSIEGKVIEAALEWSDELKRMVKVYKNILLEKISTTGSPAYAKSWLTNITKSVTDWKETPMPKPMQLLAKSADEAEVVDTAQPVTPAVEAPTAEAVTEPATPQTPEATAPDTTSEQEADGSEAQAQADEPVAPEAPAQEAEAAPSQEEATKSTPEQAGGDISTVAKAAVLGEWAEADVVWDAIDALSRNLRWFVWDVMLDSDKTADEKRATIAAALAEFSGLVTNVSNALIETGIDAETAKSVEATRQQTPEALAKSLTERETEVQELTKSVDARTSEIAEVTKTLGEVTSQLETAQKSLTEANEAKQKAETELTTIKARKVLAFTEAARKSELITNPDETPAPSKDLPAKKLQGVY